MRITQWGLWIITILSPEKNYLLPKLFQRQVKFHLPPSYWGGGWNLADGFPLKREPINSQLSACIFAYRPFKWMVHLSFLFCLLNGEHSIWDRPPWSVMETNREKHNFKSDYGIRWNMRILSSAGVCFPLCLIALPLYFGSLILLLYIFFHGFEGILILVATLRALGY